MTKEKKKKAHKSRLGMSLFNSGNHYTIVCFFKKQSQLIFFGPLDFDLTIHISSLFHLCTVSPLPPPIRAPDPFSTPPPSAQCRIPDPVSPLPPPARGVDDGDPMTSSLRRWRPARLDSDLRRTPQAPAAACASRAHGPPTAFSFPPTPVIRGGEDDDERRRLR